MGDLFGLSGQTLDGKYSVQAVIGEGGFGVVYRGEHLALQAPVAIKVLKLPEEFSEAERREVGVRFLDEARTVARLQHPAIVRAIDFGVSTMPAGQVAPWMALEWIEGQPLSKWIKDRAGRPCSPPEALHLLRPVFESLVVAHDQGIAHRDIKPANIMIPLTAPGASVRVTRSFGPAARVLDFGIAKVMQPGESDTPSGDTHSMSAFRAFSMSYAAPEQANETRTGPWTDVHALALVLVELIAGRRAYPREEKWQTFQAVLSATRPTPASLGLDAGAWEPVLAKALALKPSDRYSHAAEFLEALDESVPAEVKPLTGAPTPDRGGRERPVSPKSRSSASLPSARAASASGSARVEISKRSRKSLLGVLVGGAALVALLAFGATRAVAYRKPGASATAHPSNTPPVTPPARGVPAVTATAPHETAPTVSALVPEPASPTAVAPTEPAPVRRAHHHRRRSGPQRTPPQETATHETGRFRMD